MDDERPPDPLTVPCPTCHAPAGKRCIDPRTRRRKRPLPAKQPHVHRLWPTRRCPKCKVWPGEPCRTPSGRLQPIPHTARLGPTRQEVARYLAAREAENGPSPARSGAAASPSAGREEQDPEPPHALPAPQEVRVAAGEEQRGVDPVPVLEGEPLSDLVRPTADFTATQWPPGLAVEVADLADAMAGYVQRAQAENTTRAYESDWRQFVTWAQERDLQAMPADPATCALYLAAIAQSGLKLATVRRRAAAITRAHRQADLPSPLADPRVKTVMEGIARTHGAPAQKKLALRRDALVAVIEAIDLTTPAGLRDRALLLTGFALALRRSELVALCVEDLQPHPDGMLVMLSHSKGDQQSQGHTFLLANGQSTEHCPVTALRAWIEHAQLTGEPIFRRLSWAGRVLSPLTAQSVTLIIRRRLQAAGLPGVSAEDFAGHSLRSGFATQAAGDGYSAAQIRHVTRHKDTRTLDGYIQAGTGAKDLAKVL
jgi:site-specific recombinase XerD